MLTLKLDDIKAYDNKKKVVTNADTELVADSKVHSAIVATVSKLEADKTSTSGTA